MKPVLTREAILAAQDLRRERVEVPEWGGDVFVRTMTGTERDEFEEFLLKAKARGMRAELVARTLTDEAGVRLFQKAEDIELLGGKASAALDRLFTVAQRLNGFSQQDIEDLEGN